MTSLIQRDKVEAKKKGLIAAAAWGGTALVAMSVGGFLLPVAGIAASSYLTWRWFTYRAKRGMRF